MRSRLFFYLLIMILVIPGASLFAQPSQNVIAYGESVTGTISDTEAVHQWTFEGSAGDQITVSMEAVNPADGMLDSYLRLLDPNGEVVAENDDASNLTVNSTIEEFTLPADGAYT